MGDGIGPALAHWREITRHVEKMTKPRCPAGWATSSPDERPSVVRPSAKKRLLGRDAEGLDVTHREVVADGEALTGHQRGLVRWVGRDATTDPLCDGALHDLLSAG